MSGIEEESYLDKLLSSIEQDTVQQNTAQQDASTSSLLEQAVKDSVEHTPMFSEGTDEAELLAALLEAEPMQDYIEEDEVPSFEETIERENHSNVQEEAELEVNPSMQEETKLEVNPGMQEEAELEVNPSMQEEAQPEAQLSMQEEAQLEAHPNLQEDIQAEATVETELQADMDNEMEIRTEVPSFEDAVQIEGENIESETVFDLEQKIDVSDMQPDYSEPQLSESDMQRLEGMELDSLIEDVTSDSYSVEDLFSDDALETKQESNLEPKPEETLDSVTDITPENASVTTLEDESTTHVNNVAAPLYNEQNNEVAAGNTQSPEREQLSVSDNAIVTDSMLAAQMNNSQKTGKKSKKEKVHKEKKNGGFGAALKSIFFESDDSTAETEKAKKQGKKAAQEAKANSVKESDTGLKSTVLNADGEKEIDENQKLLKEMYGKEQQDELAPKQGFFEKLKYRLSLFMKKSAEEDAAEDVAEAKLYEEKQKAKAEKLEADKVKKEEAKQEKARKAEEAKQKKAEKAKAKKPKPEPKPGDILKIKPKSMFLFVLFVVGAIMLIIMLNDSLSYSGAVAKAKSSYEHGYYDKAYEALSGIELKGNDQTLYDQVSVIMYVQRHYESYENYRLMGKDAEALDALITGLVRYETYYMKATELGVDKQIIAIREKILLTVTETYGISTDEALSLAKLSRTDYTQYYIKIEAYGKAKQ